MAGQRNNPFDNERFAPDPHTIRKILQDDGRHIPDLLLDCNDTEQIKALAKKHRCVLPTDELQRSSITKMILDRGMLRKSRYVILANGLGIKDPMALTQRAFVNALTGEPHAAFMMLADLILRRQMPRSFYDRRECLKDLILHLEMNPSLANSDAEQLLAAKIEPFDFGPKQWDIIMVALCVAKLLIHRREGFVYTRPSCQQMLWALVYRLTRFYAAVEWMYGENGSHNMRRTIAGRILKCAEEMDEAISFNDYTQLEHKWQIELASRSEFEIYQSTLDITRTLWRTLNFLQKTHDRDLLISCFDKPFDIPSDWWWQQQANMNTDLVVSFAELLERDNLGHRKEEVLHILEIMGNVTKANIQAVDNALERHRRKQRIGVCYPDVTNFFQETISDATPYVREEVLMAFQF